MPKSLSARTLSPPPPRKTKRRASLGGFTLAEVLITLTIIGVIAALTIPTLMQKYQKYTYVVGLKRMYATLQTAITNIPITEGCPAGDLACAGFLDANDNVTDIDNQNFNGYLPSKLLYLLSKNLNTSEINYKQINSKTCGQFHNNSFLHNKFVCMKLSNGQIIGIDKPGTYRFIIIDVNGSKGPNKFGRDQFAFFLSEKSTPQIPKGTLVPFGSMLQAQYWGTVVINYWKYNPGNCTTQHANSDIATDQYPALWCTGRVLEEGAMNY